MEVQVKRRRPLIGLRNDVLRRVGKGVWII